MELKSTTQYESLVHDSHNIGVIISQLGHSISTMLVPRVKNLPVQTHNIDDWNLVVVKALLVSHRSTKISIAYPHQVEMMNFLYKSIYKNKLYHNNGMNKLIVDRFLNHELKLVTLNTGKHKAVYYLNKYYWGSVALAMARLRFDDSELFSAVEKFTSLKIPNIDLRISGENGSAISYRSLKSDEMITIRPKAVLKVLEIWKKHVFENTPKNSKTAKSSYNHEIRISKGQYFNDPEVRAFLAAINFELKSNRINAGLQISIINADGVNGDNGSSDVFFVLTNEKKKSRTTDSKATPETPVNAKKDSGREASNTGDLNNLNGLVKSTISLLSDSQNKLNTQSRIWSSIKSSANFSLAPSSASSDFKEKQSIYSKNDSLLLLLIKFGFHLLESANIGQLQQQGKYRNISTENSRQMYATYVRFLVSLLDLIFKSRNTEFFNAFSFYFLNNIIAPNTTGIGKNGAGEDHNNYRNISQRFVSVWVKIIMDSFYLFSGHSSTKSIGVSTEFIESFYSAANIDLSKISTHSSTRNHTENDSNTTNTISFGNVALDEFVKHKQFIYSSNFVHNTIESNTITNHNTTAKSLYAPKNQPTFIDYLFAFITSFYSGSSGDFKSRNFVKPQHHYNPEAKYYKPIDSFIQILCNRHDSSPAVSDLPIIFQHISMEPAVLHANREDTDGISIDVWDVFSLLSIYNSKQSAKYSEGRMRHRYLSNLYLFPNHQTFQLLLGLLAKYKYNLLEPLFKKLFLSANSSISIFDTNASSNTGLSDTNKSVLLACFSDGSNYLQTPKDYYLDLQTFKILQEYVECNAYLLAAAESMLNCLLFCLRTPIQFPPLFSSHSSIDSHSGHNSSDSALTENYTHSDTDYLAQQLKEILCKKQNELQMPVESSSAKTCFYQFVLDIVYTYLFTFNLYISSKSVIQNLPVNFYYRLDFYLLTLSKLIMDTPLKSTPSFTYKLSSDYLPLLEHLSANVQSSAGVATVNPSLHIPVESILSSAQLISKALGST
ncbi:hypothetical protein AX774_g3125 [Zancudomyces culisetae]|uniref:Uncharacterized protein n=1 Tax=Zancudomyces culisetae TaxID=1213189 RepID=A0A1R1PQU8_ZANCU|nr:hypothetical protein AX774_g3125 [Zancudomyces culisetae]|eukprot:OMH83365.1 hypothetical protein AX774_g3125 [Zancudomyces culisetae]